MAYDVIMAVQYDPAVIYKFAERLYARATTILVLYGLFGLAAGGIGGAAAGAAMDMAAIVGVVGALVGAGLGVGLAIERGFALRLQAQQALCQVKIEECVRYTANLHGAASAAPAGYAAAPPIAVAPATAYGPR